MSGHDALGDRMKRYEAATRHLLPPRTWAIIRVDGKNFHGFTKHCAKPFDYRLLAAFEATAQRLVEDIHGSVLAYHQSDEISVVVQDLKRLGSQQWLGGVVQKIASVAASMATANFNDAWQLARGDGDGRLATFDARVFTVGCDTEVINYLLWRQQDAIRNSVNMAASSVMSHKSLHGQDTDVRRRRLLDEHGIDWEHDYPARVRHGTVTRREVRLEDVTYHRKDTGELCVEKDVPRSHVVTVHDTPRFYDYRNWLADLIDDEMKRGNK